MNDHHSQEVNYLFTLYGLYFILCLVSNHQVSIVLGRLLIISLTFFLFFLYIYKVMISLCFGNGLFGVVEEDIGLDWRDDDRI